LSIHAHTDERRRRTGKTGRRRRKRRRRRRREGMMGVGKGGEGRQTGLLMGAISDEWQGWRRRGRGREEFGGIDHLPRADLLLAAAAAAAGATAVDDDVIV